MMATMWERLDVEFSFEVGDHEKHTVAFQWREGAGEARMAVDGVEVLRERHAFGIKLTRRYEVTVGQDEAHRVTVEKTKSRLWGGRRRQSFRVLVDDRQIAQY